MINFFKNRYKKIRGDTKKFAKERNVDRLELTAYMYAVSIILVPTTVLAVLTYTLMSFLPIPEYGFTSDLIWSTANIIPFVYAVIIFFTVGKYVVYAFLYQFYLFNKLTMYGINKLDSIWWRKYKKNSPVTEGLARLSTPPKQFNNLSRQQKKVIRALLIIGLILLVLWMRWPTIENTIESYQEIDEANKIRENELGKVYDGLEKKVLVNTNEP